MAKSNAERQAAYRANRRFCGPEGNGERQINTFVSTRAAFALERLARHYCVTKKELLERLLISENDRVISGMEPDSAEWDSYFTK